MICHLVHMCKDATVVTRVSTEDTSKTVETAIAVNHDEPKVID